MDSVPNLGERFLQPKATKIAKNGLKNSFYYNYLLYRKTQEKHHNIDNVIDNSLNSLKPLFNLNDDKVEQPKMEKTEINPSVSNLLALYFNQTISAKTNNFQRQLQISKLKETFFPYRKSFLCYWLLPFVGFVYSAELAARFSTSNAPISSSTTQIVSTRFSDKHYFNFGSSSNLVGMELVSNSSLHKQNLGNLYNSNLLLSEVTVLDKANNKSEGLYSQTELLRYCAFYISSLETYLKNSNSNSPLVLELGNNGIGNSTHTFFNGNFLQTLNLNHQQSVGQLLLNASQQSGKFKWVWYHLPISLERDNFKEVTTSNFHLKLELPVELDVPSNTKMNDVRLEKKKAILNDSSNWTFNSYDSYATLENPISSYLKAARLFDLYSNKTQSTEAVKQLPIVSTPLFEKFFSYNTLLNHTNPSKTGKSFSFSPLFLKEGLLVGINFVIPTEGQLTDAKSLSLSENNKNTGLNTLSKVRSTQSENSIVYEKFSKKKLYNYLFQSLCKTIETQKSATEMDSKTNLSSSTPFVKKQYLKYSHPLLMSQDSNLSYNMLKMADGQRINQRLSGSENSVKNAFIMRKESSIPVRNLNVQQKETSQNYFNENVSAKLKNGVNSSYPSQNLVSVHSNISNFNSLPSTFLNIYQTKLKDFLVANSILVTNPVTTKLTTLLGTDTYYLDNAKQLNLILEKGSLAGQIDTTQDFNVGNSKGSIFPSRASKIEKILRTYFSQKNSGYTFASLSPHLSPLAGEGKAGDDISKSASSFSLEKSSSGNVFETTQTNRRLKSVAYLQTHLTILKKKMYSHLNNVSKFETKSFWLKLKNVQLKSDKVAVNNSKGTFKNNKLFQTNEFRKTQPNLKILQLINQLPLYTKGEVQRPSERSKAFKETSGTVLNTVNQKKKLILNSNNTIRVTLLPSEKGHDVTTKGLILGKDGSPNSFKRLKFSPRLLVNSRLFLSKVGLNSNVTMESFSGQNLFVKQTTLETLLSDKTETDNEKSTRLYNVLKSNQKKRRRKKFKKETRRRKKRKRFYPRPSWIRFQLYKTISQNRYDANVSSVIRKKLDRIYNDETSFLTSGPSAFSKVSSEMRDPRSNSFIFAHSYGKNNVEESSLFYGTDKKAFSISGSVSRELKRSLWKSYWLRSNLNTYLMNVEMSLKNIKQSTQAWEFFKNIRTFMRYVLGFNSNLSISTNDSLSKGRLNDINVGKTNLLFNSGLKENNNLNKWETALYLAEYNKISTARIQQWISQIRENLTLNGQMKIRSSNVSPLTNSITQVTKKALNKNSDSIMFTKLLNLVNPNSNSSLLMPSASQLRYYWAFSKTSTATTKDFPLDEKKWTTTKIREQTKNNKTKKLSKDATSYLQTRLNEGSFVTQYKDEHLKTFPTQFLTNKKFFNAEFLLNLKGDISLSNPSEKSNETNLKNLQDSSLANTDLNSLNVSNEALLKLLEKSLKKVYQQEEKLQILGYPTIYRNFVPNNRSLFDSFDEKVLDKKAVYSNSNFLMSERSYVKLTNKSAYWWSANGAFPWDSPRETSFLNNYFNNIRGHLNLYSFYQNTVLENPLNSLSSTNPTFTLWTSALLFHFCTLLSIFSISQIRGLFKFYLLLISKVYKTSLQVLGLTMDSVSRLKFDQFTTLSKVSSSLSGNNQEISLKSQPKNIFNSQMTNDGQMYRESKMGNVDMFLNKLVDPSKTFTLTENLKSLTRRGNYQQYDTTKRHFYTFTQNLNTLDLNNSLNSSSSKMSENQIVRKLGEVGENRLFLYFFVNACLKKPLYMFAKINGGTEPNTKLASKVSSANSLLGSLDKGQNSNSNLKISQIQVMKTSATLKTLLILNLFLDNTNKVYTKTAKLLKEAKTQFFEGSLRSIYTFLEKPGELIIDWIAYLFLVEWASDITNTVPENIDLAIGKTSYKITRNLHFVNASSLLLSVQNNLLFSSDSPWTRGLKTNQNFLDFMIIGSTFLQYRLYHLYEILLMQFYQPDTDLIVRQKKGVIFWDIWGDFLMQVAEDSNINISELTSLKEEQIRLFEKCETLTENNFPFSLKNYASSLKQLSENSLGKKDVDLALTSASLGQAPNSTKQSQKMLKADEGSSKLRYDENPFNTAQTLELKKFGLVSSIQTILKNSKRPVSPLIKSPLAESSDRVYLDPSYFEFENNLLLNAKNNMTVTWGAQQFLSYQGKDTELFIDLHPRGSLELVSLLKSNSSIQQPIGSLVCQIFSGLLSKQISKNMLIVGSYNNRLEKTLLVQAIAGETELKIITDSAYRYAMVYRGVAVGIKLLRDVFDSLVATGPPCLFLIEDIHAIGERRPMLISDDENSSETSQAKSDEIHEKNQVLYQLSKHMITHYKKPYKGDFSLLIPTNHFCFDFFLGVLSREGSQNYPSRKHPVSSKIAVNNTATSQAESSFEKTLKEIGSSFDNSKGGASSSLNKLLTSRLHIKKSELLAPPATSPFSVLTLKEEKKFKPTKLVKEMPWAGLPGEQYSNLISSKASYSIRVKVALLADMAISSLSVKLDMITDLLVIIDSVKGNRGFVVFATTHVPYILDPALRRPGRFDETISLGLFPTIFSRWEVLKSAFSNLNSGFSPNQTYSLSIDFSNYLKESLTTNLQTNYQNNLFSIQHIQKTLFSSIAASTSIISPKSASALYLMDMNQGKGNGFQSGPKANSSDLTEYTLIAKDKAKSYFSQKFNKQKRKILSQTYFNASQMLVSAKLLSTNKTSSYSYKAVPYALAPKGLAQENDARGNSLTNNKYQWESLLDFTFEFAHDNSRFISLYASPHHFKNHLVHLISGKLGEIFLFTGSEQKMNIFTLQNGDLTNNHHPHFISSGVYSSTGIATWQALTALIQSFIHKRFIYNTNLIVPKLLNFTNYSSLLEPSSPPSSSILLPARRYENYRRSLAQSTQKRKTSMSIFETIQLHQQQRNVKRLYRLPVQESFRSEIIENRLSGFSNASNMIGSYEAFLQKPTSTNWFVRNRIFMRHQNYLTNQWWNGQLPEHNAETTYLSDIDWRYTFIESIGDLSFDFPDADQHYSPRNRRWLLTTGSYKNWFDFDKDIYSEIYSHLIFESFIKAFHIFEQNREILDFYAFSVLKNGLNTVKLSHESLKLHQRFF